MVTSQKLKFVALFLLGTITACSSPEKRVDDQATKACVVQELMELKDVMSSHGLIPIDSICEESSEQEIRGRELVTFTFSAYVLEEKSGVSYLMSFYTFESESELAAYCKFIDDNELILSPYMEKVVGNSFYRLSTQAQMYKGDLEEFRDHFYDAVKSLN